MKPGNYFVFFANWMRRDNANGLSWFIENVLPGFNNSVDFLIIGSGLTGDLYRKISQLGNFKYLGFVDNPYNIIANARALISPLFSGAGVKVKVIEALACGTPVVGTPMSFEGLPEKFTGAMICANDPVEFVTLANNLQMDIKEKVSLKEDFLASYGRKAISSYINSEEFENSYLSIK
jgi:glycosyltransferase involved in cell wall biosynthesis